MTKERPHAKAKKGSRPSAAKRSPGKQIAEIADFGREVRVRREALGMTLEALAHRTGLTQNYIGSIERGQRDPSLSTIEVLAKGLGILPGVLCGSMPTLGASAEEMARLFDTALPVIQKSVLQILRDVVEAGHTKVTTPP
jgi:transcriptional regulator with XRE-family HTH domain